MDETVDNFHLSGLSTTSDLCRIQNQIALGSQADSDGVQEDEQFWLKDGLLVVVVGDVKFRVSQSILTRHSPLFADVLSLPQSAQTLDTEDRHPVLRLYEHPADIRRILHTFMPSEYVSFLPTKGDVLKLHSASCRVP